MQLKLHKMSLLLCFLFAACGTSDEQWVDLFNGQNLEGWHTYGAGTSYDGWYVKDEVLYFDYELKKEVRTSNLVTDKKYTNFELSLDWKISHEGNSGIFWGVTEDTKYEHPYQTGPEIQLLDDTWKAYVEGRGDTHRAGSLYGMLAPSKIVSKPPGEWNNYLLHINQTKNVGYLKFNGTKVLQFPVHGSKWEAMIAASGFADWTGFGKAKTGHISFQDHGGKVAFKNIKIRELYDGDHE